MIPTQRTARLVLVSIDGRLIGALPPIAVETPWWQDIAPVVRATREHFGITVVILRLLSAERPQTPGGAVTYLAEVAGPVPSELLSPAPWTGALDDQPLRHSYARPGGPAADLAWAKSVLEQQGMPLTGAPEQIRTWNLSSVWRLPVAGQQVWLKVVPPFMAREGDLLEQLADAPVPRLLGHDGGRCLLAEIPGTDLYEATRPLLIRMVTLLVGLQIKWPTKVDRLLAAGLQDWRAGPLTNAIVGVVERTAAELADDDRRVLSTFVAGLPQRFAALAACGLPDTLVHGDFHPGNVRGNDAAITLLDWGDSCVGHPLLDQTAFLERLPHADAVAVREHWSRCWRAAIPHADPERAARLLAPIAAAKCAVIFRRFLDHIEPAEHPYHRVDPPNWLHHTADLLRQEDAR